MPTLKAVAGYLAQQAFSSEIVVVDDGSTDATAQLVADFANTNLMIHLLRNPHQGKGGAVKSGMLWARGEYRFLCDADLSMPIDELAKFLPPRCDDYDIAIGSREAPGAHRYNEPPYRHLMGRIFNGIVRLSLLPGIQDTQCGFKCFRGSVAEILFPLQRNRGFGFDVEILFLAQRRGMRIVDIPIEWYHERESKVSPLRDTIAMLRDIIAVRWRYMTGRYR